MKTDGAQSVLKFDHYETTGYYYYYLHRSWTKKPISEVLIMSLTYFRNDVKIILMLRDCKSARPKCFSRVLICARNLRTSNFTLMTFLDGLRRFPRVALSMISIISYVNELNEVQHPEISVQNSFGGLSVCGNDDSAQFSRKFRQFG